MNTPPDSFSLGFTFQDLFDAEAWARLAALAEQVEVPEGAVLLHEGDRDAPLYVIARGSFEVVDTRGSPETVLSVLGPGAVLGDLSFIDQGPASAEVRARTAGACLRWEAAALVEHLEEDTEVALQFYRAIAATAVARSRTVLSAAVVGGFGATRSRPEGHEIERIADTLAEDLRHALAAAAADPARIPGVFEALTATCHWFVGAESGRAAQVGLQLREALAPELHAAATTAALLSRQEGVPAEPHLFRHILAGVPVGADRAGELLDAAMLELPTLRGWRWRDQALGRALHRLLPPTGAKVLQISLTGAPVSDGQVAVLQSRGGHVTSVHLVARPDLGVHTPGLSRTTVVADLPSLLRGVGLRLGGPHHVIIVDRVTDVVPDDVLASLLAWARVQLAPQGALLVGHALPSPDVDLLDHLLRWPSLPRRTAGLAAQLPRGGVTTVDAPLDDEAAGLLTWRARD